jgi:site-specific recombinase XerD
LFVKIHQDKERQDKPLSAPTVKQHLAALRMLFDWLVIGQVSEVNPAHAVHGPKHVVRKGKTSVLTAEEARELLDSIPLVRNTGRRRKRDRQAESTEPSVVGLRDRALIATMIYSFARINAVLQMKCVTTSCKAGAAGCVCMRKAARSTRFPAITTWKRISMNILQPRTSLMITTDLCSARLSARPANSHASRCGSRTPTA